jgi:hypothetical protein
MINVFPVSTDIIAASATATTAGIVTVPGGRWMTANIVLSGVISGVGTATPNVTYDVPGGTSGAAPANGTVLHEIVMGGLLGVINGTSCEHEIIVYGGNNGCTLNFNLGGATSAICVINGFLI